MAAGRASSDANGDGIWGAGGESEALAEEVIEGMPADWLQKRLGAETTRQVRRERCFESNLSFGGLCLTRQRLFS